MPKAILGSRAFKAGALVAGLVGLYALLGFQVAPGIVRDQARKFVQENYGRELAVRAVRVQPFKLQLEVRDLTLPDADGTPMVAFARLFVDFELASLWRRAFVFKDVTLDSLHVRTVVRPDGRVNLADLALEEEPEEDDAGLPALWLQSFTIERGKIDFLDLSRAQPFERKGRGATFTLEDFRTTGEGGDFSFAATTEAGESIDWKGNVVLEPEITSRGEFRLGNVSAPGVAEFLGDALPFVVSSGLAHLEGAYRMSLADGLRLEIELPQLDLAGTKLRPRGGEADWIEVPNLTVSGTAVALPQQTVQIAKIAVSGLKAQAWITPDGSVNLAQLFEPATETPAPAGAPEEPWTVGIGAVELTGAAIEFEDRTATGPAKKFVIAPLEATVGGASLDLAKPLPVTVKATINGEARLSVGGTLTPEPLAADFDVALEDARLAILQPYVLPLADLTIMAGTLGARGKARLVPEDRPGPRIIYAGDVTISGLRSIDNALKQDFINFKRLELQKLEFGMDPDALTIDRVRVSSPYARMIVSAEQIVNIAAVLDPAGTAAVLNARRAQAAAEAAMTPAEKRRRERQLAAAKKAEASARKARGAAPPPVRAPVGPERFPVRIREVRIDGGRLNFSDYFVQPNFSADVRSLSGTIRGVSSAYDSRAKVDLKGNLGEFSPVSIAGELQPFAFDHYTDLAFDFENISLPVFNPYSGRLAGYNIAKGKLTTRLHYRIEDRKLDAAHKIRIDQLEWGEATATKGEATLPVKFATVLLRDRHGVIDLDVPVKGTLDDPTFRIGPIVWQIIKNIIVKAVTAPFALLGSLFAGAEDAQFVDFAPGDATVPADTAEKLTTLARGLGEKPGLNVDVPIGAVAEIDRPALADRAYAEQLSAAVRAELGKRIAEGAPTPEFATLEPKRKIDVLTSLLKRQGGPVPAMPEPPAAPDGASRAEARALRDNATIEFLAKEARARVTVTDGDIDALGQRRGEAIQHVLLTGSGLEPARVFMRRNGKVSGQDGKVRFELGLE